MLTNYVYKKGVCTMQKKTKWLIVIPIISLIFFSAKKLYKKING